MLDFNTNIRICQKLASKSEFCSGFGDSESFWMWKWSTEAHGSWLRFRYKSELVNFERVLIWFWQLSGHHLVINQDIDLEVSLDITLDMMILKELLVNFYNFLEVYIQKIWFWNIYPKTVTKYWLKCCDLTRYQSSTCLFGFGNLEFQNWKSWCWISVKISDCDNYGRDLDSGNNLDYPDINLDIDPEIVLDNSPDVMKTKKKS